jgi:hypothetical protein
VDIVRHLAIKLLPGPHPFAGTIEAAVEATRTAAVSADEIAQILVARPNGGLSEAEYRDLMPRSGACLQRKSRRAFE